MIKGIRKFARRLIVLPASALMVTFAGCASAAPEIQPRAASQVAANDLIAQAGEEPLTLRRQTLIVRDIDASLALYRDAIGMEVIYDNTWSGTNAESGEEWTTRLVFLKASDPFIGVLGLLDDEAGNPDHPSKLAPVRKEGFIPGKTVTLFNTTELEQRWPAIVATPGVEIIRGPTIREYPGYGGGTITVLVSIFYDPDGFIIEFNQPVSAAPAR